jgi:hypothetical protein
VDDVGDVVLVFAQREEDDVAHCDPDISVSATCTVL